MKRYDVYWIQLDPTVGSEISKTRPCVIVSPDELNNHLRTIVVAPLTSTIKGNYPYRVLISVNGKMGHIALDQIRTIDKLRPQNKLGTLSKVDAKKLREVLNEMFCVE